MCAAVRSFETPALAKARTAPLELVSSTLEALDARVGRDARRDLRADPLGRFEPDQIGSLGVDPSRELRKYRPLGARLADTRARDLGAQHDATLGSGLGPAAGLLVASHRRKEQDVTPRSEHLRRQDDV